MPKKFPTEVHDRAVHMIIHRLDEYRFVWTTAKALAPMFDAASETLRKWIVQAEIDTGQRPGAISAELEEIKRLKKDIQDLREANDGSVRGQSSILAFWPAK
jgi:transposase